VDDATWSANQYRHPRFAAEIIRNTATWFCQSPFPLAVPPPNLFIAKASYSVGEVSRRHNVFGLPVRRGRPSVRSSGQISLPLYLMNGLSNLVDREYLLALIMTWLDSGGQRLRSAKASKSKLGRRSSSPSYIIKQNWLQFDFVVKSAALKQQISKFYPQSQRTEAGYHIYISDLPVINVKAGFKKRHFIGECDWLFSPMSFRPPVLKTKHF